MIRRPQLIIALFCIACMAMSQDCVAQTQTEFDWVKARDVYRKSQSGVSLTDEETILLAEAKRLRQKNRVNKPSTNPGDVPENMKSPKMTSIGKPFWDLTPLTDFSAENTKAAPAGSMQTATSLPGAT